MSPKVSYQLLDEGKVSLLIFRHKTLIFSYMPNKVLKHCSLSLLLLDVDCFLEAREGEKFVFFSVVRN